MYCEHQRFIRKSDSELVIGMLNMCCSVCNTDCFLIFVILRDDAESGQRFFQYGQNCFSHAQEPDVIRVAAVNGAGIPVCFSE